MGIVLTMTRGDTTPFVTYITGLSSTGLTGCNLYFMAKHNFTDLDSAAVFLKTSTPANGIVISVPGDASNPGVATATLVPGDTNTLPETPVSLYWDWVLVDGVGQHFTVASGTLLISPDVYQAQ